MRDSRRKFLKKAMLSSAALGSGLSGLRSAETEILTDLIGTYVHGPNAVEDEDFWQLIKQAYTVSPQILNLNNGGVSPQPRVVQEAVERYNRLSNEAPSYYMWRILDQGREPLRRKLASIAGCDAEEIAINRNSSEGLETVIFGLKLEEGDEVVISKYAYPNMINAWRQREHRDGIVLKWIDLELPSEDEESLSRAYSEAFTSRTKLVHVTHVINWNGQVMPVRKIADLAKAQGLEVLVDGAHSFAHLNFQIPDLNCDYFGTSLHKWLSAPFGSGMLYVRKEKIVDLYPLFAAPEHDSADIRKFEHLGTRSFAIEQAIGQAADFHDMIGLERKAARLFFLKNYWVEQVKGLPGVVIQTPVSSDFSGAIAVIGVDGRETDELGRFLYRDHKIHTTTVKWESTQGVRITPNVYTVTKDLDRLVIAVEMFVTK